MFLKSSFSLPQASGFVAFDGGGATDVDTAPTARARVDAPTAPRLEPELVRGEDSRAAAGWQGSPTWQPASGAVVRRVEAAVIVAICGYFAFGLASVAGWL